MEPANEPSVARHLARCDWVRWISVQSLSSVSVPTAKIHGRLERAEDGFRLSPRRSHSRGLHKSIWEPGKTKVWGSANQYDIQINLRRMEQFVSVDLCCHSWLEPGVAADRRLQ